MLVMGSAISPRSEPGGEAQKIEAAPQAEMEQLPFDELKPLSAGPHPPDEDPDVWNRKIHVVLTRGFEPPRVSPCAPEAHASASSAT